MYKETNKQSSAESGVHGPSWAIVIDIQRYKGLYKNVKEDAIVERGVGGK